jgi:hypothetical protein
MNPWLERSGLDLPYHPRGPTDHYTTTATAAANTSYCSGVGGGAVPSRYYSIMQTIDTYSHLLEDIGGDAVGGLDEAFG